MMRGDGSRCRSVSCVIVCFQAEDGIRDLVRSRGLGDVYKRQPSASRLAAVVEEGIAARRAPRR